MSDEEIVDLLRTAEATLRASVLPALSGEAVRYDAHMIARALAIAARAVAAGGAGPSDAERIALARAARAGRGDVVRLRALAAADAAITDPADH